VKHEPAQIKKLNSLIKRLKTRHKNAEAPPYDPTTQLIMAFLQADASRRKAEQAYSALMEHMVDNNELRVSHTEEIVEIIGEKYPRVYWRVERMREALNEVYRREHDFRMVKAAALNKKEQRQYLDTLPGITPYAAASVMLLSFGGHAIPVDDKLNVLLAREGAIDEGLEPADAESLLLRQFKAGEQSVEAHLLMQAWSDTCKTPTQVLDAPEPSTVKADPVRDIPAPEPAKTAPAKKATAPTAEPVAKTTPKTTKRSKKK
jgi:endonuclease III